MQGISADDPEVRRWFRQHEGRVRHMYKDSKGFVTVGIGFMIPTEAAAARYTWNFRGGGTLVAAGRGGVIAEYRAVSRLPKGYQAAWYRQHTKLELSDAEIERVFGGILEDVLTELRANFPGFDRYPRSVQLALLDMAYNLGTSGLLRKFPNFVRAVRARRWVEAGRESYRPDVRGDVRDLRNNAVRELFEQAASMVPR